MLRQLDSTLSLLAGVPACSRSRAENYISYTVSRLVGRLTSMASIVMQLAILCKRVEFSFPFGFNSAMLLRPRLRGANGMDAPKGLTRRCCSKSDREQRCSSSLAGTNNGNAHSSQPFPGKWAELVAALLGPSAQQHGLAIKATKTRHKTCGCGSCSDHFLTLDCRSSGGLH